MISPLAALKKIIMKSKTEKRKAFILIECAINKIILAGVILSETDFTSPVKKDRQPDADRDLVCAIKRCTIVRNRLLNELSTF